MRGDSGPVVNGRVYADPRFLPVVERYHRAHVDAHIHHRAVSVMLPKLSDWMPEAVLAANGHTEVESATSATTAPVVFGGDGWNPEQPGPR
jgi:hypothetical protein